MFLCRLSKLELNLLIGYFSRSHEAIPHLRNPFWMFSLENDFLHTSSLDNKVENSDFDRRDIFIFIKRLNKMLPRLSFSNLKADTSNGCNKSVVWADNLIVVTFFSFPCYIVPYHRWDKCPSNNSNRGSSSSVPCESCKIIYTNTSIDISLVILL